MSGLRNSFFRVPRIFSRWHGRHYSAPPPTYPTYNPIHVSPEIVGRRSMTSTFLRWCLAGAFVGLPGYWILWLGQKVSIPYYVSRLDSFQTKLTTEQKGKLARIMVEAAMEKLLLEIKTSIGLPFQIDFMPGTLTIKTPYLPKLQSPSRKYKHLIMTRRIDPTRIIYRLDISRAGISRSQRTFNPADISSWYVDKDILPESTSEGEVGYKSLDDIREGYIAMEGMVKVTGPREMGGRMGTVEFSGIINVENGQIVIMNKAVLRVMGKRVVD